MWQHCQPSHSTPSALRSTSQRLVYVCAVCLLVCSERTSVACALENLSIVANGVNEATINYPLS